jgi:DNA-3-methyladenine glycosylase I
MLVLEGAQAGLSWETVLAKREGYRALFAGFDPAAVAAFGEAEVVRLLADPRIIRHRGKIESAIGNARALLALAAREGSFAAWLWRFTEGRPVVTRRAPGEAAPPFTPLAVQVSKALKREGFRFVGPTTVQSFLQAAGLLDDHEAGCWRAALSAAAART